MAVTDLMSVSLISFLMFSQLNLFKIFCFFQPFVTSVPTFLRPVACLKFEMSSINGLKCNISPFKHLMCSLCSFVNKKNILAHVI